jgi:hypothetical protein
MPNGEPRDNALRARVNKYKTDQFVTPKQFEKLSWNHLDQIGDYNKNVKKGKPKPGGSNIKTHAQWQRGKKGKKNERYKN